MARRILAAAIGLGLLFHTRPASTVASALSVQRAELAEQASSVGWPSWNRSREQARAALDQLAGR